MRILIFDTETTHLLSRKTSHICKIVQLSWIVYNTKTKTKEETDFILNTESTIENSFIHGITTKMSQKGYYFGEIIDIFIEDLYKCDIIVGHNLNYDLNALEVELHRLQRWEDIEYLYSKPYFDTMKKSIELLNYHKYPKLQDLYYNFFNQYFNNSHNALEDVRATLSCYLKLTKLLPLKIN